MERKMKFNFGLVLVYRCFMSSHLYHAL